VLGTLRRKGKLHVIKKDARAERTEVSEKDGTLEKPRGGKTDNDVHEGKKGVR